MPCCPRIWYSMFYCSGYTFCVVIFFWIWDHTSGGRFVHHHCDVVIFFTLWTYRRIIVFFWHASWYNKGGRNWLRINWYIRIFRMIYPIALPQSSMTVIWCLGRLDRFISCFSTDIVPCINVWLRVGMVTSNLMTRAPAFRWESFTGVSIWDIKLTTQAYVRVAIPFVFIGCLTWSTSISSC